MTTEQMRSLLGELREGLVPLVAKATGGGPDGGETAPAMASPATSYTANSTCPPSAS